ncbi:hypothetical protein [Sinorhizobium glycinis]|uniref:hypothetical protein n=1 Tax=Sinorhizobium glycinis TaxID=1472378 RepID=UPI0012E8CAAA|nr:hypothetical protein [Sinorhizobium glycinis]
MPRKLLNPQLFGQLRQRSGFFAPIRVAVEHAFLLGNSGCESQPYDKSHPSREADRRPNRPMALQKKYKENERPLAAVAR